MAAKHYDAGLTIMDSAGNVLAGRNCLIYSDRAATSQVLTVTLYDGTTVSGGIIPSASDGRVKFAESTGAYNGLYVQAPDGQVYFVAAEETNLAGGGGGGNVSDNTSETITGAWAFSTNPTFNDGAIPLSKVSGLPAALTAAANPVYRGTVANQSAMLTLPAGLGDSCKRTDTGTVWFLWSGSDPTILANWVEIPGGTTSGGSTLANKVTFSTDPASFPTGTDAQTLVIFYTSATITAIPPGPAIQIFPQ